MKEIRRMVVFAICIVVFCAFALGSGESSGATKVGEVEKESGTAESKTKEEEDIPSSEDATSSQQT
ncbi:MAG: hypothetical protein K5662_04675 [Lachnospiraceae bacterium]|nr:hypothetical protein [Lachnospiraceae bacterium]